MTKKKQKAQPKTVQRVNCPSCGELQVKIYPFSSYLIRQLNTCTKCQVKSANRGL